MNLRLVINPEAEADIADARSWYRSKDEGLEADFVARLDVVFDAITRFPELYAVEFEGLRLGPVRRFPYAVAYRLDDDQITVVAVYHTASDPSGWQSRA